VFFFFDFFMWPIKAFTFFWFKSAKMEERLKMIARNRYKKDQWDEAEEAEDKKDPAGSPHIISRPEEPSSLAPRQAMTPTRLQDGNIR